MISIGTYNFKTDFWRLTGITRSQWDRRREDLLNWLENFFDYELLPGSPMHIVIKEVFGEYQPLPRKNISTMSEKIADYDNFTIAALGTEFKPNSKSRVAREAIDSFALEKYGHTSHRAVAARFIKPAFEKYGESDKRRKWVWYNTYEIAEDAVVEEWRNLFDRMKVDPNKYNEEFYFKVMQEEDIAREKAAYKAVIDNFKLKHGDFLVLVESWRVKR